MSASTQKSIIKGTLILTIAGILSRFLGFYNRIFLTNLFGARELGIYQMIFPVYMVIFSFCCQGIQTALTRQIARPNHNISAGFCLLKHAVRISLFLSILCSFVTFFLAKPICYQLLRATECIPCLKILSLAFPFVSLKGCLSGYFIGIQKSVETAWGQLVEQIAKIGSVYLLSVTFFSMAVPKAYFAVWGIVAGEIVSYLLLLSCYLYHHKQNSKQTIAGSGHCPRSSGFYCRELLTDAVPLTVNRLSLTGLQCLESILIPHMLNLYLKNGDQALILYGTLTGMVLPCIMFPTTLTASLSTMLLPAISSEHTKEHSHAISGIIRKSICFCLIIGIFSSLFLLFFGNWSGQFLFQSATAGELLFQFALLCPFIYLSACLASIMNGLGLAGKNLLYSIISIAIRIICILTLVPQIGLTGYMWGMMLSYLLQTGLLLISIRHRSA